MSQWCCFQVAAQLMQQTLHCDAWKRTQMPLLEAAKSTEYCFMLRVQCPAANPPARSRCSQYGFEQPGSWGKTEHGAWISLGSLPLAHIAVQIINCIAQCAQISIRRTPNASVVQGQNVISIVTPAQ
jgi:hypothetical protein